MGLSAGMETLCGQAYGAKNYAMVRAPSRPAAPQLRRGRLLQGTGHSHSHSAAPPPPPPPPLTT